MIDPIRSYLLSVEGAADDFEEETVDDDDDEEEGAMCTLVEQLQQHCPEESTLCETRDEVTIEDLDQLHDFEEVAEDRRPFAGKTKDILRKG